MRVWSVLLVIAGALAFAQEDVTEDTLAYWQFDKGAAGEAVPTDAIIADLSGNGNDLMRVDMSAGRSGDMTWSDEQAETMPGTGSVRIVGNNQTQIGGYFQTLEGAPLNTQTFENGYTIEAFIKLPDDWDPDLNAWTGILSRNGTGGDVGKTGSDPDETVARLGVSNFPEFQWAVWPVEGEQTMTNWSDQFALDRWYHVAIVNNGSTSIMYVNGEEMLRNPSDPVVGIATADLPWTVGGSHYANRPNSFNGWIGDVRIVDQALPVSGFLTSR